jgi:hypothetical protein
MQTKDCVFKIKQLDDGADGSFVGWGSVYDNVDIGGDTVMPGAFTKTLSNGGTFPLLWQHDSRSPIGTVKAMDATHGLQVQGQLLMSLQKAQEAYALLKAGVIKGLSIGYDTINSANLANGVRQLTELKLWEISLVTFPMNEAATVGSVKGSDDDPEFKAALRELAAKIKSYRREM